MYCIFVDAHLSYGDQLTMHDVFPLRGIDLFKVSTHYACSSTLHMSLHTTHVPPHYTCPSTLHLSLRTTHFPPQSLFLILMRKHCLVLMCAGNTRIQPLYAVFSNKCSPPIAILAMCCVQEMPNLWTQSVYKCLKLIFPLISMSM